MLDNLGCEILGDQAVLRGRGTIFQMSGHSDEPVPVRLELDRFSERTDIQIDRIENIYQMVIQNHARSILENRPMDGLDGYHNLRQIGVAHESARREHLFFMINLLILYFIHDFEWIHS